MAKFQKGELDEYLGHLRAGMRPGAAAEVLGKPRDEVLRMIEEDDSLMEKVKDAEKEATEHVEEALYQAAVSGNVTACRIWLDLRKAPSSNALTLIESARPDTDDELAGLNKLAAG